MPLKLFVDEGLTFGGKKSWYRLKLFLYLNIICCPTIVMGPTLFAMGTVGAKHAPAVPE